MPTLVVEIVTLIGITILSIERIVSKIFQFYKNKNEKNYCCNGKVVNIDKNDKKQESNCYKFTE